VSQSSSLLEQDSGREGGREGRKEGGSELELDPFPSRTLQRKDLHVVPLFLSLSSTPS